MSGYITCEDMAKNNIDSLKEALQIALEALDFYADKENYKEETDPYDDKLPGFSYRKILEDDGYNARYALHQIKNNYDNLTEEKDK